ncbi:metal-dependent hydrolase [Haloarchaeobius sp. HME9146]|uniref:metal-dependent hydrolase n=1 Tax=Haloarchaeobius sp. HME9146 TaxID=2978732 RepID=UPI0021BE1CBC|nr:metal-dependent hydrolase [Haloarchaeobius sp. HME9146]MCT9097535.1 metal-dependent hydrolase [Haloarchaeobius sp. HME9146]
MPSTVVHVALAAIIGCALLGPAFSGRALLVVMGLTAFVDLDVFLGFVLVGAHRAAFHTLLFPAALAGILAFDLLADRPSKLAARFGPHAPRIAGVAVVGAVFGAIGPDLMTNGVNVFWPLHDQFYALTGKLHLSNQEGIIQTFVEFENGEPTKKVAKGSTREFQYYTGVDTNPDRTGEPVTRERIFPLVDSGVQLLLVLTGGFVSAARLWEER